MGLWPEDFEDLRDAERIAAHQVYQLYGAVPTEPGATPSETVSKRRARTPPFATSSWAVVEEFAEVPCRVFRPRGQSRGTYIDIHGGAMVLGDATMGDLDNERLARELSLTVVSIDYRLAPEHPYPAASDDCLRVTEAVVAEIDEPLLIGGSSAGGYLAAVTILRARDELDAVGRFIGCVFNAGYFDCSGTPSASGARPSQIPDVLDDGLMPLIAACYFPDHSPAELRDPRVSPLYALLHDLPPALFSVGSADHLLDDSMFMAARWQAFGNVAELALYPDATHGSMLMGTPLGEHAKQRRLAFIAGALDRAR